MQIFSRMLIIFNTVLQKTETHFWICRIIPALFKFNHVYIFHFFWNSFKLEDMKFDIICIYPWKEFRTENAMRWGAGRGTFLSDDVATDEGRDSQPGPVWAETSLCESWKFIDSATTLLRLLVTPEFVSRR